METVLITLFALFASVSPIDNLPVLWNHCVEVLVPFLKTDILTELNNLYAPIFKGITEPLQVVGYALTILLWLYGILKVESTLAEMKRPEAVFKHMLRLIIMIWLVQYAPDIVKAVWDIGVKLALTVTNSGDSLANFKFIVSGDNSLFYLIPEHDQSWNLWNLLGTTVVSANLGLFFVAIIAFICVILNIGARIAILLCAYQILTSILSRFFRLMLLYLVSPIAASACASEETQRVSIQFAKNLIAVSSEMALTIILLRLFKLITTFMFSDTTLIHKVNLVISYFLQSLFYDIVDASILSQVSTGLGTLMTATALFILLLFTLKSSIRGLNSIIDSLFGLHGV